MRLAGKVVIITGAGSGLGRASAELFATNGAHVVAADIDEQRALTTVQAITDTGTDALAVTCDVRSEADVARLVETAVEKFGHLDVMFNNAGIPEPGHGHTPFYELDEDDYRNVIDVNVLGIILGCKHAVAPLRANGGGVILNTSSAAALVGYPNFAIYAASKGAVNAFTRNLAVDLGPFNIRANALCPAIGMSANFLRPSGSPPVGSYEEQEKWDPAVWGLPLHAPRPPSLEDNANCALFLASDESMYVSGVCLTLDGGKLSRVPQGRRPARTPAEHDVTRCTADAHLREET